MSEKPIAKNQGLEQFQKRIACPFGCKIKFSTERWREAHNERFHYDRWIKSREPKDVGKSAHEL